MIVSWNTTNACNMYCKHCYRDAGCRAEEELNTAEAKTLLDQIAKAGFKIIYCGFIVSKSSFFSMPHASPSAAHSAIVAMNEPRQRLLISFIYAAKPASLRWKMVEANFSSNGLACK